MGGRPARVGAAEFRRRYYRDWAREQRALRKRLGWCISHKGVAAVEGRTRCAACMDRRKERERIGGQGNGGLDE